ncbi:MAG: ExeM/NucH family extracellular endonuclease, partial [Nocardioides sp.]
AGDANRVAPVTFDVTTRTSAPADVGGDLQVASFNVLNYFTDLGVDLTGCTYFTERDERNLVTVRGGCDARGAAEADDFERQEAKIVRAINALGAEVVSLSEIENSAKFGHPRDESLATLVDALNADLGSPEWAFVPSPADGPAPAEEDFIRNAFIYKPAAVSLLGDSKIRPSIGTSDPFVNARDPLAQVFQPVGAVDGDRFMLVVNHFKSKGSPPRDSSDVNRDYGQGAWNVRRTEQAAALATCVGQLQAENGVKKVYLDGDFNSYTYEDPMLALYGKGYTNLDVRFGGGHTYQFDGLVGSLDHGLANEAALASTTGATVWNINSVEPIALEYSRYNYNATIFYDETTPYRASDHDPILFGIDTTPIDGGNAAVPPM